MVLSDFSAVTVNLGVEGNSVVESLVSRVFGQEVNHPLHHHLNRSDVDLDSLRYPDLHLTLSGIRAHHTPRLILLQGREKKENVNTHKNYTGIYTRTWPDTASIEQTVHKYI